MQPPAQHATSRTDWFKSSYSSSTGTCVEVRVDGVQVAVRDSKNPHAVAAEPVLNITADQWTVFTGDLQA